jgi:hypothetical protein
MRASRTRWRIFRRRSTPGRLAFTLVELLLVIAVNAILAALILPSFSQAKSEALGFVCMGNTKQMAVAWRMYSEDNHDTLVTNGASPSCWYCNDWETLDDRSDPNNWDSDTYIRASVLWPYCGKSTAIWHCPGDHSVAFPPDDYVLHPGGHPIPRIRSISMDGAVGFFVWKMSGLTRPGPAQTFVFLDEREDSINDGYFNVSGSPDFLNDFPASYHLQSAGINFADGHSEIHRWRDSRTMPPISPRDITLGVHTPGNQDAAWLSQHSPPE